MYYLDDYNYELPEALIAQTPADKREGSRLLHLNIYDGKIGHYRFEDVVSLLDPSDVLVVNDTKVIPGRLLGRKSTGGKVEALILNYADTMDGSKKERIFRCLVKSSKKLRLGSAIFFDSSLNAEVLEYDDGIASLRFISDKPFEDILQKVGKVPLPPYIKRDEKHTDQETKDRKAYQTVYATHPGAIAAPTAGLHFSPNVMDRLTAKGIEIVHITLHVGYGTFLPVRVNDIRKHKMHSEWYSITPKAAACLNQARQDNRRIIAVGTTSVRTLEYHSDAKGRLSSGSGSCDLFIYPGYRFKLINGLITNFHLPRSTLLMLVAALAGRENILSAYKTAVKSQYRFFSYGDAMLII
ncbi:MAG: tRNA preQ1(34) S-adenosylmethionine ribosyltransferase-isomerase QueA [Desulfobacteraceae bacterium]|jgi:S-adenosylmethionine:tRNA ribosyltransferase-isomerase